MNTGNNLLYLLVSALLGFMAVSGVLGKWNLSKIRVFCTPPREIYDGLPTLLKVSLENRRRWLPVFLMEVVVGEQTTLFPLVDREETRSRSIELTLHGRGRQVLPDIEIRSRFPINFFIRGNGFPNTQEVTVFPRPQACPNAQQPDPGGERGARYNWQKGQDGDISRIRDYQGGEPLKLIHWKLSARHDRLKVKELSATTRTPVVLDLENLPGPSLEIRLRCAAYLVTRLIRAGRPVGLKTGAMEISPDTTLAHKLMLLNILALYGTDQNAA